MTREYARWSYVLSYDVVAMIYDVDHRDHLLYIPMHECSALEASRGHNIVRYRMIALKMAQDASRYYGAS